MKSRREKDEDVEEEVEDEDEDLARPRGPNFMSFNPTSLASPN